MNARTRIGEAGPGLPHPPTSHSPKRPPPGGEKVEHPQGPNPEVRMVFHRPDLKPPDQLAVLCLRWHLRVTPAGYTQIPVEALTVLASEGRGGDPPPPQALHVDGLAI